MKSPPVGRRSTNEITFRLIRQHVSSWTGLKKFSYDQSKQSCGLESIEAAHLTPIFFGVGTLHWHSYVFHQELQKTRRRMLFGHHVIDKTVDEHFRNIAAIATDSQTLIFLDTNILSYLYKLHEAARREFFAWSDAVAAANRLVVPAWAASEYLARVTSNSLDSYTPKSKGVEQVKRLLGRHSISIRG